MLQILAISKYSGAALRELRTATAIAYDELQRGILQIYTDREGFDDAARAAELVRQYGIAREVKTPQECVTLEPALSARLDWIVGGTYTATDETGDARKFTQALAALAAERGVAFRFGVSVESLAVAGGTVCGVRMVNENNRKEVCRRRLSFARATRRSSSIRRRAWRYPAKGTGDACRSSIRGGADDRITDDAEDRLTRLAIACASRGTAELAATTSSSMRALRSADEARDRLVGAAIDPARAEYGRVRPATPSNVPLIGRTRYPNSGT
jgi:D-amino-acid dehydrogenase